MMKYRPIKSLEQFRNWLEEQPGKLRAPDLNLLIDPILSTPSDDEVCSFVLGLCGESIAIKTFLDEAVYHRQQLGISPNPYKTNPTIAAAKQVIGNNQQNVQQKQSQPIQQQQQQQTQSQTKTKTTTNDAKIPQLDRDIHSYEPVALSHQQAGTHINPSTQQQQQQTTKMSFASKASKGGKNNTNITTTTDKAAVKHATSHSSSVFFTEDDKDVLNIAQLHSLDLKSLTDDHTTLNGPTDQDKMFPTLSKPKKDNNTRNAKSQQQDVTSPAEEFVNDARFQFVDKRKKKETQQDATTTTTSSTSGDKQQQQQQQPEYMVMGKKSNNNNNNISQTHAYEGNEIILHETRNVTSRLKCGCMCRTHNFYANCHDCGRIVCWLEGEGDCFHCGSYIINYDANREILAKYGKNNNNNSTTTKDTKDKSSKKSQSNSLLQKDNKKSNNNNNKDQDQDLNMYNTKDLNLKGHGIICIKNELFAEQMYKITSNAKGYFARNPHKKQYQHQNNNNENKNQQEQQQEEKEDKQLLNNDIKEKGNESIAIRENSAYGQLSTKLSANATDEERVQQGLLSAIAFRDTLLQREAEKAKRTKVIDEQSDYYSFNNNIWLDDAEIKKQQLVAQKIEDLVEDTAQKVKYEWEFDPITKKMKQVALHTGYSQTGSTDPNDIDVSMYATGGVVGGQVANLIETIGETVDKELKAQEMTEAGKQGTIIYGTGKVITLKEQQQRKEFLIQKRRVEMEVLKQQQEEAEKALQNGNNNRKKRNNNIDPAAAHLSGKSLEVFNALRRTLNGDDEDNNKNSKTKTDEDFDNMSTSKRLKYSSWAERLAACADLNDLEYEYYTENPDALKQLAVPEIVIDDGPMGILENNGDKGGGCG